jgi:riboflavin transporter FmnP
MILAGLLSALGLLFLIFKFGIRRIIAYDIPIDITVTAFLMYAFAGTYSGMIAAMVGGLIISITLFIMKRTMRREVLMFVKTPKFPYRAWRWIEVDPND